MSNDVILAMLHEQQKKLLDIRYTFNLIMLSIGLRWKKLIQLNLSGYVFYMNYVFYFPVLGKKFNRLTGKEKVNK
jgi:hypothetical protein